MKITKLIILIVLMGTVSLNAAQLDVREKQYLTASLQEVERVCTVMSQYLMVEHLRLYKEKIKAFAVMLKNPIVQTISAFSYAEKKFDEFYTIIHEQVVEKAENGAEADPHKIAKYASFFSQIIARQKEGNLLGVTQQWYETEFVQLQGEELNLYAQYARVFPLQKNPLPLLDQKEQHVKGIPLSSHLRGQALKKLQDSTTFLVASPVLMQQFFIITCLFFYAVYQYVQLEQLSLFGVESFFRFW